jgi:hypothetical protein
MANSLGKTAGVPAIAAVPGDDVGGIDAVHGGRRLPQVADDAPAGRDDVDATMWTTIWESRRLRGSRNILAKGASRVQIDFHGYRPSDLTRNGLLIKIVQQCWEMGETELRLIHGHGRARGKSPGFVNTNTGGFGLLIRRILRNKRKLRQWIKYTTLDCRQWGMTRVKLKANPAPSRTSLDPGLIEDRRHLAHLDWHQRDPSPPNGTPGEIKAVATAPENEGLPR